jgi:hypothetical protein
MNTRYLMLHFIVAILIAFLFLSLRTPGSLLENLLIGWGAGSLGGDIGRLLFRIFKIDPKLSDDK